MKRKIPPGFSQPLLQPTKRSKEELETNDFGDELSDDSCFEVMRFLDFRCILLKCCLISKQWFRVAITRNIFHISISTKYDWIGFKSMLSKFELKSENLTFLGNVESLHMKKVSPTSRSVKYIGLLKGLTALDLSGNHLGDDITSAKTISSLTQLTSLNISHNLFNDEGAKYIGLLSELTELDINGNCINEGVQSICSLKKLKTLSIGGNSIYNDGVKLISQLLNNLTSLNVCYSRIDHLGVNYIRNMTSLQYLDISDNNIGPGAKELSKLYQLTYLNISNCNIFDDEVRSISTLDQLKHLVIFGNRIYHEGIKSISSMIQLQDLDISFSGINYEGAKYIGLLNNLTSLDVSNNNIDGVEFISGLKNLTRLDLTRNEINVKGVEILSSLEKLVSLKITRSHIGVEGCGILRNMKQLTQLDIN